jgi:hypothetical protein
MRRLSTIIILIFVLALLSQPANSFEVWWDKVHETITYKAIEEIEKKLSVKLEKKFTKAMSGNKGVRYPDMPEGLVRLGLNLRKRGTLTFESHYGKKQYWHSMAFPGAVSAEQVKAKIIEQAREWFGDALEAWEKENIKTAGELLGRVLHMVQDSFSRAHVKRDARGRVEGFQDYGLQDPGKHAEADSPEKGNSSRYEDLRKYLPGAEEAMEASRDLLGCFLRKDKASFNAAIEKLYKLAPDAYPRPGALPTEELYKKNE